MTKEFEFTAVDLQCETRSIKDILADSKSVDIDKIAKEVFDWLIANVENYIDNHKNIFQLNFVIDDSVKEGMEEIKKLQNLYRAIPEDVADEAQKCRRSLDEITKAAYAKMQVMQEELITLFKRLIFYYEMKGLKNGIPIIQEMEGVVKVINFDYEAFSIGVQLKAFDEETEDGEKKVVKEYVVPEGFTCWIELIFHPKVRQQSMF